MHTILLFPSTLEIFSNMSHLVLLSSLSVLPQKVWTTNKEHTHVPYAGTCTDPFLHSSPSKWMCALMALLQLSTDNHYRADYFVQGCDRGACEIFLMCKYQLKIKKGESCTDFSFWHSFQILLDHAKVQIKGSHHRVQTLH